MSPGGPDADPEPEAIVINYYLKADQPASAKVTVTDVNGRVARQLDGPGKPA